MERQTLSKANRPTLALLWFTVEPDLLTNIIYRTRKVLVYIEDWAFFQVHCRR
jgi:hypothetical protein